MNETKLKPCPFCGGEQREHPQEMYKESHYAIYHDEYCFLSQGEKPPYNFTIIPKSREGLIKVWNTRHVPELPDEEEIKEKGEELYIFKSQQQGFYTGAKWMKGQHEKMPKL